MPAGDVLADIRCPIHWVHRHCSGLGLLDLKRHWQLSDDELDSESQLDCNYEGPSMDYESFPQATRAKSLVNYSLWSLSCKMWDAGSVELDILPTLYINNSARNQARS
ncbi:unnamed protein product [Mesocestoides corti]|uniref:Uncharacterized protein n=1 Tax=Mesocestoides corti TaxID=53468 RepID=A0A0R3URB1_MESCO|nr:unnamed protein product [Mesocestoides corti]